MKNYLRNLTTDPRTARIAVICALALALAAPTFATSSSEVLRTLNSRGISGDFPQRTGEIVTVNFANTPSPIVVTWQGDVASAGRFLMSVSVNGQPCGAYGGSQIPYFLGTPTSNPIGYAPNGFSDISMQWVVLPSDGLVLGNNTIELCAGAHPTFNHGASFLLGFRTLTVRKGN
jgi:hypothetical protein